MRKIVVITDCVDVAWNEIRGAIYAHAGEQDVQIEPVIRVDSYNICHVNFLLKLIAEIYPENTIISVIVNPLKERTERIIGITNRKNIIFEGTNTGAFGWLIEDFGCKELYEIYDPGFVPFGGKYIHAPTVGKVVNGFDLKSLGTPFPIEKLRKIQIKEGTILHIDNFGNLKLFHKFKKQPNEGDKIKVEVNGVRFDMQYSVRMMSNNDGEIIIYPGSSFGLTEIGIVRGNFAERFNVKIGDVVSIGE